MNPQTQLSTDYDYVVIIDFLNETESRSFEISVKLAEYLKNNKVSSFKYKPKNLQGFRDIFSDLKNGELKGKAFLLHFVGHGSKDGIHILNFSEENLVSWKELAGLICQFPEKVQQQLLLNLSCCFGLNVIKVLNYLNDETGFFGALGSNREITPQEAKKLNTKFYKKMLNGQTVNRIIDNINQEFGEDLFYGITSFGYRTIMSAVGNQHTARTTEP